MKKMVDKQNVDFFIAANAGKFEPAALVGIRESLMKMDENQFLVVSSTSYRDPTMIVLIAVFLGWERFFLDDVGMGIAKVLTCYGLGIWWLIDIFTAQERTHLLHHP